VEACSTAEDVGILEAWETVKEFTTALKVSGEWEQRRARQALDWMWRETAESLLVDLKRHPAIAEALPQIQDAVQRGDKSPTVAAMHLVKLYRQYSSTAHHTNGSVDL
ncbi:MAG TPA: hypothetical protein VIK82_11160, partial [Porticoccaceae bacterium]